MNTPAHAVLSALVLAGQPRQRQLAPAIVGAVLADVPMMLFYAYQRLLAGQSEYLIWVELYHDPHWQAFFDIFNSLPLISLGALLAWYVGSPWLRILFASMALHGVSDFLVHHHDAHQHFFPLSDWRFQSPVSYWDPRYHGDVFLLGESIFTFVGVIILTYWYRETRSRYAFLGLAGVYGLYFAYAMWAWG